VTPLDLRSAPPRPPREAFLGVTFLPRTIDKLRALLPGGDSGAYRMTGFSLRLFEMFGTNEARALAAVRDAADDLTAARAIVGDASAEQIATLNATLESIEPFVMFRERAHVIFRFAVDRPDPRYALDLILEDDRRSFGITSNERGTGSNGK